MHNKPKPEQFGRLPLWAHQYICDLERQRDVAVRELRRWIDAQTPSGITVREHPCLGEAGGPSFLVRFIQGTDIQFDHAGVQLNVSIHPKDKITLRWSGSQMLEEIAFVPTAFQSAYLVDANNMVKWKKSCG